MTKIQSITLVAAIILALAGLPDLALAQDLRKVQPNPIPQIVDAPSTLTGEDKDAPWTVAALQDEKVVLATLKGVFFKASEHEENAGNPETLGDLGADLRSIPELQNPSFAFLLDKFIGKPASQESMTRMVKAIKLYLAQIGRPFSVVYYPEQDITDGYLQMVVLMSRFDGNIEVQGNRYFSDEIYINALSQKAGEPINEVTLDEEIAWLNRNPFRAATVVASAGSEPGTTKLVIQAREVKPLQIFTGANNTGTKSTEEERALVGFNWGNAFGLDHQLSLQLSGNPEFNHSRSLSAQYGIDLPWRHSLQISTAYSETDGIVAAPFSLEGQSHQIGIGYTVPLGGTSKLNHSINLGFDFKSSDNNFEFSDIPISDNLTHVVQLRATYSGVVTDDQGSTSFSLGLTTAPGNMSSRNKDEFFTLSRSNASANYGYLTADATRRTQLAGTFTGWSWNVRGRLQVSSHNLIGSEQFGAGGASSVRGYEEGEVYGDEGFLLSQELIMPAISLLGQQGSGLRDSFSPYVFQDFARTSSVNKLPGEEDAKLHSIGVGVRYQLAQMVSAQAAWGFQLSDSGSSDSGDNHRLHLNVRFAF